MSGILDRMAKRAVGALPGILPLIAPHFAQTGGLSAGILETNLETGAPAPRAGRTPPAAQVEPFSKRFVVPAAPAPRSDPETSSAVSLPEPPRHAALPASHHAPDLARSAPPNSLPESSPSPGAPAMPGVDLPAPLLEVPRSEAAEAAPVIEPLRRTSTPSVPAPPVSAPPLVRQPALAREPQLPPAEQKTEIHISIGSIELRTPRAEAKPAAPRFRPRVSLDDFLRRKPEARA